MIEVSICIPIFNFDIRPLLHVLSTEIRTYSINAEIILIDDASGKDKASLNEQSAKEFSVHYIQLEKNIGRSAIRNLFAKYVQGKQLIFLDCDVMPQSKTFIRDYLNAAGEKVVCGGICYADHVDENKKLHWKYGTTREATPVNQRNLRPYHHFLTGNFLVPKKIIQQVPFNENLKNYGYEDTLFAIELEKNKIELKHINLEAQHLKLDTSAEFILKIESSIENLFFLYRMEQYEKLLPQYVKLIKVYEFLNKSGLTNAGFFIYKARAKKVRNKLLEGNTNLRMLDLYKLLFFISLVKKAKQH